MVREQRWEIKYECLENSEWVEKVCYPRSEEKNTGCHSLLGYCVSCFLNHQLP